MSAPDRLFQLNLPDSDDKHPEKDAEEEQTAPVVVPFPTANPDAVPALVDDPSTRPGVLERFQPAVTRIQPAVERFSTGWRAAWIGDGVLGMRPRPVADLARQFWTQPPAYIRDVPVLRVPYALYGVPVIVLSAAAHLVLLIVSYFSLLIATCLVVLFISFFI